LVRQMGEIGAAGGHPGRVPRDLLALGRNARVQLEGAVLDFDVVLAAQLVDPRLADVAVRSDEVAVDGQLGRHRSPPSPFPQSYSLGDRDVASGMRMSRDKGVIERRSG